MSKLDDAFLKAYAKVRTPSPVKASETSSAPAQPSAAADPAEQTSEETSIEELWTDRDGVRVVLPDEGIVNVASFIARTSSGRTRGTSTRGGGAIPTSDTPDPQAIPDHEDLFSNDAHTVLFDNGHALQGPHFNPVAIDLAALDQLTPVLASAMAAPATASTAVASHDIGYRPGYGTNAREESRDPQKQSEASQTVDQPSTAFSSALSPQPNSSSSKAVHPNSNLVERDSADSPANLQDTPQIIRMPADNVAEHSSPDSEDTSEPPQSAVSAEPFVSAWEVDRFEFEPVVCQLSDEASPLWSATEQLRNACHEGLRVLAVASPIRGQGRSTLAITLAKMLSACGMNVALVDGNLDHPSIAEKLRLDIRLGWNDATRTGLPVEEVAVQSIEDGLTVLPLAAPDSSRNARPSSEATTKMLSRLRSCFDLVILDTAHMNIIGGWLPGTDSPCQIDAALVIDDLRQDDAEAMQACLRRLQKLGIEHVGLVENFAA